MTTSSPHALAHAATLELLQRIDAAIEAQQHTQALRLILSNYSRFEDPALLRERTALALAARGRKKEAVVILELLGRHYAHAGYPTRSLMCIKQLQTLQPDHKTLLDHFSALYHIRSPHLGEEARHRELPAPADRLDLSAKEPQVPESELFALAYDRAADKRGVATQPQGPLPPVPLLSLLPQEALRRVLDFIQVEIFAQSQPLHSPDQPPQELIWSAAPNLLVRVEDDFHRLPSGSLVGLNGFAQHPLPSPHPVMSARGGEALRLPSYAIESLHEEMPDFGNRLATLRRHALTERLVCTHPLFVALASSDRLALMERFVGVHAPRGEYAIRQHKPSPGLFIVLDGQVDIVRQDDPWEITIATLGSGDVFGEIGLVSDNPAVAGVVTSSPCILLFLSREEFTRAAAQLPALAQYASRLAQERIEAVQATLSASDLAELD